MRASGTRRTGQGQLMGSTRPTPGTGARFASVLAAIFAYLTWVLSGCILPELARISPPPARDVLGLVTPEAEAEGRAILAALGQQRSDNRNFPRIQLRVADHREGAWMVARGDAQFLLSCRWTQPGRPAGACGDPEMGTNLAWHDTQYFYFTAPLFCDADGLTLEEARVLLEGSLRRLGGYYSDDPAAIPPELRRDPAALEAHEVGRPMEPPAHPVKVLAVDGRYPSISEICGGSYPLGLTLELVVPAETRGPKVELPGRAPTVKDRLVEVLQRRKAERDGAADPLVCVRVGGDVMLSRRVATAAREIGWERMMGDSAGLLRAADIAVVNLESPIGTRGRPLPGKKIWFRAPPDAVAALTAAGVDAAVVANNHILDYDTENFLETLGILQDNGIKAVGGGKDIRAARTPVVIEAGGVKIGLLAYSEFASPDLYWSRSYPRTFMATNDIPGVAPIAIEDLREDVRKATGVADVVMVAFHWGAEDTNVPLPFKVDQRKLAREALDAGASAVLGFHPHAVQGVQAPKPGKWILYSLGNLVMDQKREIQKESMVATLWVNRRGIAALNLTPLYIRDCSPLLPDPAVAERIRQKIRDLSLDLCETAEARARLIGGQSHRACNDDGAR